MSNTCPVSAYRNDEEPDSKAPDPECCKIGHDLDDLRGKRSITHEIHRESICSRCCYVDHSTTSKAARSNGNEHTRPDGFSR